MNYELLLRKLRHKVFEYEENGNGEKASRLIQKCKDKLKSEWDRREWKLKDKMAKRKWEMLGP